MSTSPTVDTAQLSDLEQRVLDLIDEAELVSFLQALIRQRSDHPPGDCRGAIEVVGQKLLEAAAQVMQRHPLERDFVKIPIRSWLSRQSAHCHFPTS